MAEGPSTPKRARKSRRAAGGPTVADVAAAAGVSPMTVSRVVNGDKAVQPRTREKVEAAIALLDYVPNTAARNLAGARQCRIGLVFSNPSASYLSELLVGALEKASTRDAQLVVERWAEGDTIAQFVQRLKAHRIDGVLLPAPLCDDEALLDTLKAEGMQVAQVAPGTPCAFAHAVTIDDLAAAETITAHLLALGHRRIGFIAGNPAQAQSGLRRAGYEKAMRAAGIAPETAWLAQGDFSYRSGLVATEALLAADPRPTAIFASNDDMAAAAVAVAHRHRLAVPDDLTICGFDDSAMASSIWPELTTIRQPIAEMAGLATDYLIDAVQADAMGDKSGPRHGQLAYALVRRSSDAPPAA